MNFLTLEIQIFKAAVALYFLATIAYCLFFLLKKELYGKIAQILMLCAFITHTAAIAARTIGAGRLPLSNQYEFSTCFAWGITLCFIIFERRYSFRALGTFVAPVVFILIGYAALQNKQVKELMPALQSNWLTVHVASAIISYGAFGVAFGTSILFLIRTRMKETDFNKRHIPNPEKIDVISYRSIALGFLFLTLVIITGAIWAERAWGRYWSWDPKETWSLITWIIYALYLHVRLSRGWKGKRTAIFSIIGFLCVIVTYIGVNLFIPSIHSYASVSVASGMLPG